MSRTKKTRREAGSVRIIGGAWRRRRIPIPQGTGMRPSPDRVRETLFNWLGPALPGAVCLDLFAGSGVLGLEALSRGARRAVFVERDPAAAAALERIAAELGGEAEVVAGDAAAYVGRRTAGPFDIVFVDPPYAAPVDRLFTELPRLLSADARVYLERAEGGAWPAPAGFDWIRRASAGAVAFGLARLAPAEGV